MEWSLEQLRQFVTTAETGSFSAAARKLGKAQSAVSTAISLLEVDLNVELFDRSQRNAQLTEAGQVLLLEASEVLRQAEELAQRAQFFAKGNDAKLTLAFDEALPCAAISTLLRDLAERFPDIELTLLNGTATEVMSYLDQAKADLAFHFDRASLRTCFEERPIGAVPQAIFVASGHALHQHHALTRAVTRRDLARYRQLMMYADDVQTPAYSPKVWRSDSFYSIAEMVADDLGWAILPINVGTFKQYTKPLQQLDCPALALPLLSVRMLWCQGRPLSATEKWVASRFAHLLKVVDQAYDKSGSNIPLKPQ